jgi:hypothetical protein
VGTKATTPEKKKSVLGSSPGEGSFFGSETIKDRITVPRHTVLSIGGEITRTKKTTTKIFPVFESW